MIEIKQKRDRSSRVKFPRAFVKRFEGTKLSRKQCYGKLDPWWNDDWVSGIPYRAISRYLKSQIGKPIDKIYSVLKSRCKKCEFTWQDLMSFIDEKDEIIGLKGGFYLSNGILNWKKGKPVKLGSAPYYATVDWNTKTMPSHLTIRKICEVAKETHTKQKLAKLHIRLGQYQSKTRFAQVYVIHEDDLLNDWRVEPSNVAGFGNQLSVYPLFKLVYFHWELNAERYWLVTKRTL